MLLRRPAGAGLFQKIQLDDLATAARAYHRRAPQIVTFAREIDFLLFQCVRELIDPDTPKKLGTPPRQVGGEPPRHECDHGP